VAGATSKRRWKLPNVPVSPSGMRYSADDEADALEWR